MKRFAILVAGVLAVAPVTAVQAQAANTQAISFACSGTAATCRAIAFGF